MGVEDGDQPWNAQGSDFRNEKIFVSVRLRPLNEKEAQGNDFAEWECNNNTTLLFKNCLGERSMYPISYTFDRVFGHDDSTRKVYEEAAKEIALSVLNGINSSIFAYGQTSSGKTFTMTGITQYAVADIYDYIEQNMDREYVLKFSALEIYNEHVRDLLSTDTTPLRLLDDPERGTVVEKLTEEILSDKSHLLELIAVCEAQRQTGETNLNETSSRSHQILRLTIESSARKFGGNSSMLAANVNFVDLAGSERTSQTLATGTRLKEGSHINRSLLTLGKVIRTLSKGRNGHIPYRDSKLTRILQNSLGGNARTAIICTMSPAHSHLEQSRNTLLFASCAKEVATNAQVNVVMSDKAMVKQLRKELAKLENELKNMSIVPSKSGDIATILREKELQIEKMDKEIKELSRQRDLAQSKVEELLQSTSEKQVSQPRNDVSNHLKSESRDKISWLDDLSATSDTSDYQRQDADLATAESFQYLDKAGPFDLATQRSDLLENIDKTVLPNESFHQNMGDSTPVITLEDPSSLEWENMVDIPNDINRKANEVSDDDCKEVRCIEIEERSIKKPDPPPEEVEEMQKVDEKSYSYSADEIESENEKEHDENEHEDRADKNAKTKTQNSDAEHDALVQKIKELQRTIDMLVNHNPFVTYSPCSTDSERSSIRGSSFSRSRSCKAILTSTPTSAFGYEKVVIHSRDHSIDEFDWEISSERSKGFPRGSNHGASISNGKTSRFSLPTSIRSAMHNEMEQDAKNSDFSEASSFYDVGTNGDAKYESDKEIIYEMDEDGHAKTKGMKSSEGADDVNSYVMRVRDCMSEGVISTAQSPLNWVDEFENQRIKIIELWEACHIPLVHRTYFYLLFKGDPSDKIYMEVELRRLSFIKNRFDQGQKIVMDGQVYTPSSSIKALTQERETLMKQMYKKIPSQERESVFEKWGITIDSKQRRLQLARLLWTDTKDMRHIRESANLVAKLVGFVDDGQVPKEMFVGPNVVPKSLNRRSYSWKSGV